MSPVRLRIERFSPALDASDIAELRGRLAQTRWPADEPVLGWEAGISPAYLRSFVEYWANSFSFEAFEADVEAMPHHLASRHGQHVHFLHARSARPDALPLILTHGWPSSFLEYAGLIEELVSPTDPSQQAFHVVIPSLPGFGYSSAPIDLDGYQATAIADLWASVMAELGYRSFVASGADIGARVTGWLAARHREVIQGIHVSTNVLQMTSQPATRPGAPSIPRNEDELWLRRLTQWERSEGAYEHVQKTKPVTLAIGLNDSPAGLASWIIEKWHAWAPGLDFDDPSVMNMLARQLTLYWTTGSVLRSFLPYYVYERGLGARPPGPAIACPVGLYVSESDIGGVPPRSFVERQLTVTRWSEFTDAGHFPAVEAPETFADDLRRFIALLPQAR